MEFDSQSFIPGKPPVLDLSPVLDLPHALDKPLAFNSNVNPADIKNILLIDSAVSESKLLYDSANKSTFPIIYSYYSTREELTTVLNQFTSIDRVSFVFHDSIKDGKLFIHAELFFQDPVIASPNTQFLIDMIRTHNVKHMDFLTCNSLQYKNWVNFYDVLSKQTGVIVGASNDKTGNLKHGGDWILETTNEDILQTYFTDSILNYNSTLSSTISSDGGNIYIRQTSNNIQYKMNSDETWTNLSSWPVMFVNTSSTPYTNILTVSIVSDITIWSGTVSSPENGYFITGSQGITYDGSGYTVYVVGGFTYSGLIQNGFRSDPTNIFGYDAVTVQNIKIIGISCSIAGFAGWICSSNFGYNISRFPSFVPILIKNCSNIGGNNNSGVNGYGAGGICGAYFAYQGTGIIENCSNLAGVSAEQAGGIVGAYSAFAGSVNTIINCSSIADESYYHYDIQGAFSGGIVGCFAGYGGGELNVMGCYNTKLILGPYSGGIVGGEAGIFGGKITIEKCYNVGDINGVGSGGIVGLEFCNLSRYNGNNLSSIVNCYNIGKMKEYYCGGICGGRIGISNDVTVNPHILIENCYSLGGIESPGSVGGPYYGCGGICGGRVDSTYANNPVININNCYSYISGIVSADQALLHLGATPIQTSCYEANGSWSDANAKAHLDASSVPISTYSSTNPSGAWTSVAPDTPYVLSAFNSPIYSPSVVSNSDVPDYTSLPGLFTNSNYSLVSVNDAVPVNVSIDTTNGTLSFVGNHKYTTYKELVFVSNPQSSSPYYYGYNVNTYQLTQLTTCFKEGTKILTLNIQTNEEEYVEIQNLNKGDLVKTALNGYVKIQIIGHSNMYNHVNEERTQDKLYVCTKENYPEIWEDLVLTSTHSILVDEFKNENEREKTRELNGDLYVTDRKYRLPAYIDERTEIYEVEGYHKIWHLALENSHYYGNYGIYANGLLVESTSINMMENFANMVVK